MVDAWVRHILQASVCLLVECVRVMVWVHIQAGGNAILWHAVGITGNTEGSVVVVPLIVHFIFFFKLLIYCLLLIKFEL